MTSETKKLAPLMLAMAALVGCHGKSTGPTPVAGPTSTLPVPPAGPPSTGPIAFVSTRDGSPYIYFANADGSGVTRLTSGEKPAWSWDGRQIAFHEAGGLFVVNADGSGRRFLAPGEQPAWSPDGRRIVFSAHQSRGGIFAINADGSGLTLLIGPDFAPDGTGPYDLGEPIWSPDGRSIAFVRWGAYEEPWPIYIMNADGSEPRRLVNDGAHPAWSPDGSTIAFGAGYLRIVTVNVDGSGYRDAWSGQGWDADWSPDGRGFVFSKNTLSARARIFVLSSDHSEHQLISDAVRPAISDYTDGDAAWSRAN